MEMKLTYQSKHGQGREEVQNPGSCIPLLILSPSSRCCLVEVRMPCICHPQEVHQEEEQQEPRGSDRDRQERRQQAVEHHNPTEPELQCWEGKPEELMHGHVHDREFLQQVCLVDYDRHDL